MKGRVFKIVSSWVKNAVAFIQKDSNGYFRFGEDDRLPNRIAYAVNDSGTARACITKLEQFIQGDGFIDKTLSATPANHEQNFDDLLADLAMGVAYFKDVTYRVLFDNSGQPAVWLSVPSQQIRRKGGGFVWNVLMGEDGYTRSNDKFLKPFDPKESPQERLGRIQKQINSYGEQVGDLVYFYKKTIGRYGDIYPIPDYYSGIADIRSDAAISELENRNITKGFRTPVIVSTGPIDDLTQDEGGKTDQDYFDDSIQKFCGEDAASVLHLKGATGETPPKVTTIPIADILDATEKATDRVGRKVCRHMTVPPVLVGFSTSGQLGNNQELVNTMKLFNMTVNNYQRMIANALSLTLPGKDFTIKSLNLFNYIPDSVLALLSPDEVREIYELPKPEVKATVTEGSTPESLKAQASLRGSVGGVTGVLGIQAGVVAGTTTPESAIAILTIIYGFSDQQARALLGQPEQSTGTPPAV